MIDPNDDLDPSLRTVHDRSQVLRVALAAQLLILLGRAGMAWWAHGVFAQGLRFDTDMNLVDQAEGSWLAAQVFMLFTQCLTGLAFVSWTASLYEAAPSLQHSGLRYTARSAWAFFAPIAQLWVPYAMITELHRELSPLSLADPTAAPQKPPDDPPVGYREAAVPPTPVTTAATRRFPDAPIGAWWALWIGAGPVLLSGRYLSDSGFITTLPKNLYTELIGTGMLFASALLALRVVRLVTERARERAWRIAAAPPPMSFTGG